MRGRRPAPLAGAALFAHLWLAGCASAPAGRRAVYAYDVVTDLGSYSIYAATDVECRILHAGALADERGLHLAHPAVATGCYPATLGPGGPHWAFEYPDSWGAQTSSAELCEAVWAALVRALLAGQPRPVRDGLSRLMRDDPPRPGAPCAPATLAPSP